MNKPKIKHVEAGVLDIAYLDYGPQDGWPCILMHGFPYDVLTYANAAPMLVDAGARVFVPWMRGYGPTRFLADDTPRSGEQAAFGADLLAFMDALNIENAVLGGYDWGGRACCVVAALWPERAAALVSGNSYNIQHIGRSWEPAPAKIEATLWYQYYFHSERGRQGLLRDRRDIARTLWEMWSPPWKFDEATFEATAASFDNPDFVDVVTHSYRHRYALIYGDPAYQEIENRLAQQPDITVPTICIDGDSDGLDRDTSSDRRKFTGPYEYRRFPNVGHNMPQEAPEAWAQAVLDARAMNARAMGA
ncbi:MAG: alpha/beta hydrolase [Pseudomonadota bacterium]